MAEQDVRLAAQKAAAAITGRSPTSEALANAIRRVQTSKESSRRKALRILEESTAVPEHQILANVGSSDNADRALKDLEDAITSWNPGQ
jgi:hypothetical protein